jgi:hypothetical protein
VIPERITQAELERIRERHADIEQDELRVDDTSAERLLLEIFATPTEGDDA